MSMPRPTPANWISIVVLGVSWGAAFMGISLSLRGYEPFSVAAGRVLIAAMTFGVVLALRSGMVRPYPKDGQRRWPFIVASGLFGAALPYCLLSFGVSYVPSSFAGVSMATVPLLVLPLAHIFVPGEQLRWRRALGFVMGFAGVLVLLGPQTLSGEWSGIELVARLACIGAAASYAISSIVTRRCPPFEPVALAAAQTAMATAFMVPLALAVDGIPNAFPLAPTLALVALGLVPTALANLLRVQVIRSAGPGFMALTNFQVPLWAVIFGVTILGEPVPGSMIGGLFLILGGLIFGQWRQIRPLLRR